MATQSTEKIKVFARIRPSKEQLVQKVVHIADNNSLNISLNGESKHFKFDGLFGEESNQEEVFDGAASRIVHGTLQGYNGTIFAYGQTGSGKTHTMIGPSNNIEESGIIPRGLHLLFEQLDKKREEMPGTFSAKITVSFVEIYNEHIYDLFLLSQEKLKIGQDHDGNAMVKGATEIFVKDLNDAMEEVRRGWNNRTVGETAMNRSSSRSHALLLIKIRTEEVHGGNTTDRISTARSAFLNLVDLAGSERVSQSKVEGERFKETTNINKSLLTLKIVIRELSEQTKSGFIAFRNSVLTHILKDSLGGNARTAVMINLHPDKMYYSETVSTLNFSAEVRRIENKVVVNEDLKGESVNAYKAEIRRLQDEIENMKITNDEELAATNRNLQAWIAAANKFERQLAVARRNAVNVAIVARKDGQGAALAESIWDKSMAEIAESARKIDTTNPDTMKLRELTTELDNCEFEKEELKVQLEQERKANMELREKLSRAMEGAMSPMRQPPRSARTKSQSSQEEEASVSSMLGNARESQLFSTPTSAARKERRRTRYTPALNRQSNFFRPVLDVEGDNENQPIPIQQESFEEKELKLELEVNTQKQIIDEKIQECASLRTLLEKNEKKLSESEDKLSSALASSEEKVKELTADIEKAKKTIGEENEKFIHLEKRANELEGELMEANGQVERLESDMDLLKSTHKDEMEALEMNLKSNLSDKEKKEVDLKKEMEDVKALLESKKIELLNKETEKNAADQVLTILRDRMVKTEEEKNEKMEELESMSCQLAELRDAAENEKRELNEKIKKDEEERKMREDEYRARIEGLEEEIETKRKECEKSQQMGEASSSQLATLQESMNQLRIAKDHEITEAIKHWKNVSHQFSVKMEEMKTEFNSEKEKRENAERNEKRAQEIMRIHTNYNEELKENIAVLGSHNNTKQKQHILSRFVEDKRMLTLRVFQLETAMEKHGLTVPQSDENEGREGREGTEREEGGGEGGEAGSRGPTPRNSVVNDVTTENTAAAAGPSTSAGGPPTRRPTRATVAPSTSAASSTAQSTRSSKRTTTIPAGKK